MLNIEITDKHYRQKTIALNALYDVADPELGLNIMDLGLVYGITVTGNKILVTMTLSTPACPAGGLITDHVKIAIREVLPDYEASVELVWEPRWNADHISPYGRAALGW